MNFVNQTLDHVGVLRVQVQGFRKVLMSLLHLPQLLIDLPYHYMDGGLLGYCQHQFKEHFQGIFILLQGHQHSGLLVLVQGVIGVHCLRILKTLERVIRLVTIMLGHAQVCPQHRALGVYLDRLVEVLLRLVEFLLLETNVPYAPPSVVVAFIGGQRLLVAALCLVEVLVSHELVSTQGVGVGEVVVELNGSVEEL